MMTITRIARSSFALWLVAAAVCIYLVYPPLKKLKYGIDLVGGTYITLQVDVNAIATALIKSRADFALTTAMQEATTTMPTAHVVQDKVSYSFADQAMALQAQQALAQHAAELVTEIQGNELVVTLSATELAQIRTEAVKTNVEVLRTRLNAIGVEEISIVPQGERNIVIELPDVHDTRQAKSMIGTPAVLEFKLVEDSAPTEQELLSKYDGEVPAGMLIVPGKSRQGAHYYLVADFAEVTGRHLREAKPVFYENNQMAVQFKFDDEGGRLFEDLTGSNLRRVLAVVLDGTVISAATIQSKIRDTGVITGLNQAEAAELATLLKSGAFVGKVSFAQECRVGPNLGYDSIKRGLLSCVVSLALLFLFSVIWYKLSGLFAFFALVYNLLLIMVAMYFLGAALTLPGIAGMVLTIGMAIDSSILIFEKIKDLLRAGVSVPQAIEQGFGGVMAIILDANITHLIVGIVLFQFGSGPIKGFAVTLMVGIVSTLITGLFFLKSMFSAFIVSRKNIQKLSI
ncbi:protein translocase subunit SecD [Candidatus Dependentiae bacterium]|nr:protein translocase subunit SecD [Candidatus Dependentiae bacterium]